MYEPLLAALLTRVFALSKSSFLQCRRQISQICGAQERRVLPDLTGLGLNGVDDATALRHAEDVKVARVGVCACV